MFTRADAIFIDSRPREAFEKGHIERAWNIPYSLIDPIPDEAVQKLRSYRAVIIYCNTRGAEISTLMAGELSHEGLDGVAYLEGGFLEWVKAGGKYDGQRPEQYD
jgi:rhodanese-related sulfurtransferase